MSILSFFSFCPFLSTYLVVLFSLLYSPIGTLLFFCFPVCALVSFIPVDIILGFLCWPCQSIVLYFCWTVLILLMGVHSVTLLIVVINHAVSALCLCSSVEFSFFFLKFFKLKFFKPITIFSTFIHLLFLLFFSPCS